MTRFYKQVIGIFLALFFLNPSVFTTNAAGPSGLQIVPPAFDFGWCPDNAKITGEFSIKNTSSDLIPLTSVQPTCGCTATQFTPENLTSQQETKISLTFNTRGYANMRFNKATKVKSDETHGEYNVNLVGYVLDPSAQVIPAGDGIASFPSGSKAKSKVIQIQNKSASDVKLDFVQLPAKWASVKLRNPVVAAGKTTDLEVTVEGSVEQTRDSSVTLLASNNIDVNRLTVAIRTGIEPTPYKKGQETIRIPVRAPLKKTDPAKKTEPSGQK